MHTLLRVSGQQQGSGPGSAAQVGTLHLAVVTQPSMALFLSQGTSPRAADGLVQTVDQDKVDLLPGCSVWVDLQWSIERRQALIKHAILDGSWETNYVNYTAKPISHKNSYISS